jgi:hypothetical protein
MKHFVLKGVLLGIFTSLILSSCSKKESLSNDNAPNTQERSVTTTELLGIFNNKSLGTSSSINVISETDNYTDTNSGVTGKLYVINNNGEEQRWLFTDEKPDIAGDNLEYAKYITIATDWSLHCGNGIHGRCMGWYNFFIVWN